jgi:hypothetical protein
METHSFNVEHAILFTQEGATLLQHHYYWHKRNKANNRNFHDGSYWTFNAASAYCDIFPYLSEKQIRTLHQNFVEAGLLKEGNYNKIKFDRTKWFALTELGISCFTDWNIHKVYCILQKVKWILQNVKSKSLKVNSSLLNGTTIPVINTDINTNINTEDSGSGNVPLPAHQETYNDFLAANNFSRLSLTAFTLTDAQAQAAKIKHGEAGYLSTLAKLDDYLEKNPTYMQSKKDFNAVFRKFADNDDLSAAKIAWNAFFTAKHGQSYTKYSKADESALETILKHIKEKLKEGDSIGSKIAGFFNALSQLPKYNEPMNCKLTFIANDYTNIVAHLGKQREAQKQVVPTLSPADAKEAAIKTLAEIGLTDEMIALIQSPAKCADLQTAKNLTISQLFKAGKFDAANGDKFNQCLKVLRPMLR